MNQKVLIGSSSEGLVFAQVMAEIVNESALPFTALTWKQAFEQYGPFKYNLETLEKIVSEIRSAIYFVTPDDSLVLRGKEGVTGRVNVWLEIGMYASRYTKRSVLVIMEKDDLQDNHIPTDYLGFTIPSFDISAEARAAVKRSFLDGAQLDVKWRSEIKNVLQIFYETKLLGALKDLIDEPVDYVEVLKNRTACYNRGKEMIERAQQTIYSVLSYEGELNQNQGEKGLTPFIYNRIAANEESDSTGRLRIKRWLNMGSPSILNHANEILTSKFAHKIEIRDTYCRFIEALITDDEVLIPLPRGANAHVGEGIYIQSKSIAEYFMDWFDGFLPVNHSGPLTKDSMLEYVHKEIRKAGARTVPCDACAASSITKPESLRLQGTQQPGKS